MKLSKYNISTDITGNHKIVYNTLNSGVLSLEGQYARSYEEMCVSQTSSQVDLIEELTRGSMLVDDDFSEIEYLHLRDHATRFSTNNLGLTIAPTLKCNFACPYCYEEGYRENTMDKNIQDKLVDFVKNYIDRISALDVTWYGGEPLLKIDIIEYLSKEFLKLTSDRINYSAGIITNGYLLNKETAKKLSELKIHYAQVTIDGCAEIHNKRRILHNGEGTFDKIVNNIQEVCEILPINIRVNVDKTNIDLLDRLLEQFDKLGFKNKVPFYIAPVDDISRMCSNPSCLSMSEFSEKEIDFMSKALDLGFNLVSLPKTRPSICGAVSLNNFVVDPKGDLYKCWDTIGRESEKVGDILNRTFISKNLNKWLLYDVFKNSECTSCSSLPVCLGGCPYYYFKTQKNKCKSTKYNVVKLLELFNKMKSSCGVYTSSK